MTREGGRYIVPEGGGEPIRDEETKPQDAPTAPASVTQPEQAEKPRADKKKGS